MYKFNFLQKINIEKIETNKRSKFITTVFTISLSAQLLLLSLLYLKSLNVNSSYDTAIQEKEKLEVQTKEFRKKDFISYKNLQHIYNVQTSRRQLSYIFKSFENSVDSTVIIERADYESSEIRLDIISRSSGSKSKLMSEMNIIKSRLSEELISENFISKASDIDLIRGPDLKSKEKNSDGTQYWSFSYLIKMQKNAVNTVKKKPVVPEVKI
ncbi:MAG: hypothetical protein JXR69_09635 [Candidatus Delongbacteria bacterium]|nr:hypothetical protein [Candidatus Delongbacteria bacterium]